MRPSYEEVMKRAVLALRDLDDWANVNETNFTGWGDGDVPPQAEFWRVKTGQAMRAVLELPGAAEIEKLPRPDFEDDRP